MMWRISTFLMLLCFSAYGSSQNSEDLNSSVMEASTTTATEHNFFSKPKPGPENCTHIINSVKGSFSFAERNWNVQDDFCLWIITPQNTTKGNASTISLLFHELFLHKNDIITLYNNETDAMTDSNPIMNLTATNASVTVITNKFSIVIKLHGTDKSYQRRFLGEFNSVENLDLGGTCSFDLIAPDLHILNSPIPAEDVKKLACQYTYSNNNYFSSIPVFIFDQFNFTSPNTISVDGVPKNVGDINVDFFAKDKETMHIKVDMVWPTNDTYQLRIHRVNKECSGSVSISGSNQGKLSPPYILNNGSVINECLWIFKADPSGKLGIEFQKLHLENALDIIAINDGASENSQPLLQITSSNVNSTKNQPIRSTGQYIWFAFKPVKFTSEISFEVSRHEHGGHLIGKQDFNLPIGVKGETVFQLEVDADQVVFLKFLDSEIKPPGKLTIYDGFDKSNVLTTLHGNFSYPLLSKSSKMMVIATDFTTSKFQANFKGVSPGCFHTSSSTSEDYILTGNCNASCLWIIPPQDHPGSVLLLDLQFVSLGVKDQIEIRQLDNAQTPIGIVSANATFIPELVIPADVGALVEVNRGPCEKEQEKTVLIGHSSYVPVCGKNLTMNASEEFQITSPLYPNTYPVFANCRWKLSTSKENLIHVAFNTLKLAPNHCVKIFHASDNKTEQFTGNDLPDDIFLTGESLLEFDSSNCKGKELTDSLKTSSGFVVNGTVADCGSVLSKKSSGEFSIPVNKSLCIWKVSIPETDSSANVVNIISYTVAKKDSNENYELLVYDGASIRETAIRNNSLDTEIWSRTSNLIFIYKRINANKPSSILSIKYSTIGCNETMQCDNKICLHPDWRCNGINECGDFSDERNCKSVPIPPVNNTGYSTLTFWLTIIIMFATGIFAGVAGPFCYQKYKNGQYRRFGDISIIE